MRPTVLGQKQSADNQLERLICDQFTGCEISNGNVLAADGNSLRCLINAVKLRLDAGEPDGVKIEAIIFNFPDCPAPDIIVGCQEKQRCLVALRQSVVACSPVHPSSAVFVSTKELQRLLVQKLCQSPPQTHLRLTVETVPEQFLKAESPGFNPFLQTNALVQRAEVPARVIHAVFTVHILGLIPESGAAQAVASWLKIRRGHHHLLHLVQGGISHKVARHG